MPTIVLLSEEFSNITPINWQGQAVFSWNKQIFALLAERLGEEYANFFASPILQKSFNGNPKLTWTTSYLNKPQRLNKLSIAEQQRVKIEIQNKFQTIRKLSEQLINSPQTSHKTLGSLLEMALQVPSEDYVFVDGSKIVVTFWGFAPLRKDQLPLEASVNNLVTEIKNVEPTKSDIYSISKTTEHISNNEPNKEISTTQNNEIKKETNQNIIKNEDVKVPLQTDLIQEKKVEKKVEEISDKKEIKKETVENKKPLVQPKKTENKFDKIPAWLWVLLGMLIMFVILGLLYWFLLRDNFTNSNDLNELPTPDADNIAFFEDDIFKRKVFTDRFNVMLLDDADPDKFIFDLQATFPELEVVYYEPVLNILQIETPKGEALKFMNEIPNFFRDLKYVFAESVFEELADFNDPALGNEENNWHLTAVNAPEAWAQSKGNEIVVAVLDNGFQISHEDIATNISASWNVFEKDVIGETENNGHGTKVSGTVAALINNSLGLCGLAPESKILPIQIGTDDGLVTSLSLLSGISYALSKNAKVINISMGMMFDADFQSITDVEAKAQSAYLNEGMFWDDIFAKLSENEINVVVAAGNDNTHFSVSPMARSQFAIVATGVQKSLTKYEQSNYGKNAGISAPAAEIYTTSNNNSYEKSSGNSFAAAMVSGAIAVLRSYNTTLSPEQVKMALINSAQPLSGEAAQNMPPLLNLAKMLNYSDEGEIPDVDCDKLIDSLQTVLDSLLLLADDSLLVIPDSAVSVADFSGVWKSSQPLESTLMNNNGTVLETIFVNLYFIFNEDGTAKMLMISEKDGNKCKGNLTVENSNNKLTLRLKEKVTCNPQIDYPLYSFTLEKGENNAATCKMYGEDRRQEVLQFNLIRSNNENFR